MAQYVPGTTPTGDLQQTRERIEKKTSPLVIPNQLPLIWKRPQKCLNFPKANRV